MNINFRQQSYARYVLTSASPIRSTRHVSYHHRFVDVSYLVMFAIILRSYLSTLSRPITRRYVRIFASLTRRCSYLLIFDSSSRLDVSSFVRYHTSIRSYLRITNTSMFLSLDSSNHQCFLSSYVRLHHRINCTLDMSASPMFLIFLCSSASRYARLLFAILDSSRFSIFGLNMM